MKNLSKNILNSLFCIFYSLSLFSQESKNKTFYQKLSRFTIGVSHSNFEKADIEKVNAENNSDFNIEPSTSFFLDYRFLQYKNHSLKAGIQLNKFVNTITYQGTTTDIMSGATANVNSYNIPPRYKTKQVEFYLNYNYLIQLSRKFNLELSAGIAYEKNDTYQLYVVEDYFADFSPNGEIIPYQKNYQNVFVMEDEFIRSQIGASIGYTTEYGLISLGVKYSAMSKNFIEGQYEFYNAPPGVGQSYGFYTVSGNYLNVSVSFTPSKNIFKKKK